MVASLRVSRWLYWCASYQFALVLAGGDLFHTHAVALAGTRPPLLATPHSGIGSRVQPIAQRVTQSQSQVMTQPPVCTPCAADYNSQLSVCTGQLSVPARRANGARSADGAALIDGRSSDWMPPVVRRDWLAGRTPPSKVRVQFRATSAIDDTTTLKPNLGRPLPYPKLYHRALTNQGGQGGATRAGTRG